MKLHYIPIGIVVISMIVTGLVVFINDVGTDNPGVDIEGLNNTMENLNRQENKSKAINEDIQDLVMTEEGLGFDTPYRLIVLGWDIGKSMFGSWGVVTNVFVDTTNSLSEYGVPIAGFIVPGIITIIIFMLVAILTYGLWKWKFED